LISQVNVDKMCYVLGVFERKQVCDAFTLQQVYNLENAITKTPATFS